MVADSDDLWKFMSKSSGIDVGSLMNSWIRKMGFPVVVVTVIKTPDIDVSGKITLKLTQHRFCGGNTNSPQKKPMLWSIPIQGDYVNVKKFKNLKIVHSFKVLCITPPRPSEMKVSKKS